MSAPLTGLPRGRVQAARAEVRLPPSHGPGASCLCEAAKSSIHKTKSGQVRGWVSRDHHPPFVGGQRPGLQGEQKPIPCGVQRLGSQGEQGPSPLWDARSGAFSPQLAPRAHLLIPAPPRGKQGSPESQPCVPGGRSLVTIGSGPGTGRVPAAPPATLCNSWSPLQDRSHALGAAGQELPLVRWFVLSTT